LHGVAVIFLFPDAQVKMCFFPHANKYVVFSVHISKNAGFFPLSHTGGSQHGALPARPRAGVSSGRLPRAPRPPVRPALAVCCVHFVYGTITPHTHTPRAPRPACRVFRAFLFLVQLQRKPVGLKTSVLFYFRTRQAWPSNQRLWEECGWATLCTSLLQ
jgi:hypothetical protein